MIGPHQPAEFNWIPLPERQKMTSFSHLFSQRAWVFPPSQRGRLRALSWWGRPTLQWPHPHGLPDGSWTSARWPWPRSKSWGVNSNIKTLRNARSGAVSNQQRYWNLWSAGSFCSSFIWIWLVCLTLIQYLGWFVEMNLIKEEWGDYRIVPVSIHTEKYRAHHTSS